MRREAALGLLLCGLVCLGGCRTPGPQRPLVESDPRPARLLAGLEASADRRGALRARARVAIQAPDLDIRRPQRLAVARPGRLRFEVLGLFGQLAALLVVDGGRYQLYEAGADQLREGVVSSALLWQVARVDLEPGEAVDLLLGVPRPGPGLRVSRALLRADGQIAFERVDARGEPRERFVFDAQGRLASMARLAADGRAMWRARFSRYRAISGPDGSSRQFAFEVALDFPRVEGGATLDYQQAELVAELPGSLFRLNLPGRGSPPSGEGARDG